MSICHKQFLRFPGFFVVILFTGSCFITNKHREQLNHFSPNQGEVESQSSFNQIIGDLSFFPINGHRFRLSELKDKKAIVIVMRERNCPISEKYGPRLVHLEKQFSNKGIKFIYNYVGQIKAEENALKDLKKFGFKGSYVIDGRQKTIDTLHAKTTGDVFILTPERRVIYKGPVDDQYHLLRSALKAKNHYVLDTLTALISGKEIVPNELLAPGCIISRPIVKKKFIRM